MPGSLRGENGGSPLQTNRHVSITKNMNARSRRARPSMLLVMGMCVGLVLVVQACTVFFDASPGTALAGRNWDMSECEPVMWFVPAKRGEHGRICFGRRDDCEDGMNDQGLFVAVAAAPSSGRFTSRHAPAWCPVALDRLLAQCTTVEEAIAWWEKHPNPAINSRVAWRSFLGIKSAYKNSGVGGHILMADKSGHSVVCEWEKGKLKVIRKAKRYQLITNFLLSMPELGGSDCPRFTAATKILDEASRPAVSTCEAALKATSGERTRYSVIYDLAHGAVRVYCRARFENPKTIHLSEELKKGAHEVNLYAWFGFNSAELSREGRSTGSQSGDRGAHPPCSGRGLHPHHPGDSLVRTACGDGTAAIPGCPSCSRGSGSSGASVPASAG